MKRSHSFLLAALASFALSLPGTARADDPEKPELAEEDAACLKCHNDRALQKTLPDGKTRSLYVSEKAFVDSVHLKDGCAACHSETEDDCIKPAKDKKVFASKREQSIALMKGCVDCHKDSVRRYEESVHAALLGKGDEKTALCSSCHNPHAERFFEAANKCESCHEEALKQHRDWLPKTERHLETVACEACHAPAAERRVNLRLYEGATPLSGRSGVPQFKKVSEGEQDAGAGLDARALWSLLKELSAEGEAKTSIRGKLEVRSAADGHLLTEKASAIKECKTCHREGADAFNSVTVSMVGPDGKVLHAAADKAILSSMQSLEAVGGFYVLGATRMKALDTLLVLVLIGATLGPLTHLAVRMLVRRARARREAAARTDEPSR